MDGLAATRAVRSDGFLSLPIIALTANAFPEDVRMCREAGMSDFLAKPLRKQTLVDAVLRAMDAAREPSESPAGFPPPLVPSMLNELAVEQGDKVLDEAQR